jgi:hypothetical protein
MMQQNMTHDGYDGSSHYSFFHRAIFSIIGKPVMMRHSVMRARFKARVAARFHRDLPGAPAGAKTLTAKKIRDGENIAGHDRPLIEAPLGKVALFVRR